MDIQLHPHARERLEERGATEEEVRRSVLEGESFNAKYGRTGFRINLPFGREWRGKYYHNKQIESYAVPEDDGWLVITFVTKYY